MAAHAFLMTCRLQGYTAAALAFSLMKHETCWSSTDKAIVQQWQSGRAGRRRLVHSVHETLAELELRMFLEGIDGTAEAPEPMSGRGFLTTMSRLFLFTLPDTRARWCSVPNCPALLCVGVA